MDAGGSTVCTAQERQTLFVLGSVDDVLHPWVCTVGGDKIVTVKQSTYDLAHVYDLVSRCVIWCCTTISTWQHDKSSSRNHCVHCCLWKENRFLIRRPMFHETRFGFRRLKHLHTWLLTRRKAPVKAHDALAQVSSKSTGRTNVEVESETTLTKRPDVIVWKTMVFWRRMAHHWMRRKRVVVP